jgi:hypothetical protein
MAPAFDLPGPVSLEPREKAIMEFLGNLDALVDHRQNLDPIRRIQNRSASDTRREVQANIPGLCPLQCSAQKQFQPGLGL